MTFTCPRQHLSDLNDIWVTLKTWDESKWRWVMMNLNGIWVTIMTLITMYVLIMMMMATRTMMTLMHRKTYVMMTSTCPQQNLSDLNGILLTIKAWHESKRKNLMMNPNGIWVTLTTISFDISFTTPNGIWVTLTTISFDISFTTPNGIWVTICSWFLLMSLLVPFVEDFHYFINP